MRNALAMHKFVESANRPVCSLVLVQERELFLVELVEEVIPGDLVESAVLRLEIQSENAGFILLARTLDPRGFAPARPPPFANSPVFGGVFCFPHAKTPVLPSLPLNRFYAHPSKAPPRFVWRCPAT